MNSEKHSQRQRPRLEIMSKPVEIDTSSGQTVVWNTICLYKKPEIQIDSMSMAEND